MGFDKSFDQEQGPVRDSRPRIGCCAFFLPFHWKTMPNSVCPTTVFTAIKATVFCCFFTLVAKLSVCLDLSYLDAVTLQDRRKISLQDLNVPKCTGKKV
jgi:hypothetical protein